MNYEIIREGWLDRRKEPVTLRLSGRVIDKVDQIAIENDISRSSLLADLVKIGLSALEKLE